MERWWSIINGSEMGMPLHKKAVCFFKSNFKSCKLGSKYVERTAEYPGLALGLLNGVLGLLYDLKGGYTNVTLEGVKKLNVTTDREDFNFVKEVLNRGVFILKGPEVLPLLLRARKLTYRLRDKIFKEVLRLAEVFSAQILDNGFFPSRRFLMMPPSNMEFTHRVGRKMMPSVLSFMQISSMFMRTRLKPAGD